MKTLLIGAALGAALILAIGLLVLPFLAVWWFCRSLEKTFYR